MAYEVTATRKRPHTFHELAGQEFVVASLGNTLESGRIAHAYLFSGPRGVGKTSAARILAKSLNCESGPTANPCDTCSNCTAISNGNSLDVIEIDGASNTSVNDVRGIRQEVLFSPNSSRYKVYIIDEVHMLSNSAFNALLKTIEEPPPYVIFIFATTEVHKVPATIRSRCQQFNFRLIGIETIAERLREAADEMEIEADQKALFWIAKESTGSLRDGYTLFDQIVSFADGNITMALIQDKLGLVGFERIDRLVRFLIEGNAVGAIELAEEIVSQGVSVERVINDLTEYFRGMLLLRNGITRPALVGYDPESFTTTTSDLSVRQIEYILGQLFEFYRSMRYSLNQRFELEHLLSRLSVASHYVDAPELVARLENLRNEIGHVPPSTTEDATIGKTHEAASLPGIDIEPAEAPSGRPAGGVPKNEGSAPSIVSTEEGSRPDEITASERQSILDTMRRTHLSLATALENCGEWRVEDSEIIIECPSRFHAETLKRELPLMIETVRNVTGRSAKVRIETANSDGETTDDVGEQNSGVEMIKRVFRGEIVENGSKE